MKKTLFALFALILLAFTPVLPAKDLPESGLSAKAGTTRLGPGPGNTWAAPIAR